MSAQQRLVEKLRELNAESALEKAPKKFKEVVEEVKGPPGEKGVIVEIKLSKEPDVQEEGEDFVNPNVEVYSLTKVVRQVEVEPEPAIEVIENGHDINQNEGDAEVEFDIAESEKRSKSSRIKYKSNISKTIWSSFYG